MRRFITCKKTPAISTMFLTFLFHFIDKKMKRKTLKFSPFKLVGISKFHNHFPLPLTKSFKLNGIQRLDPPCFTLLSIQNDKDRSTPCSHLYFHNAAKWDCRKSFAIVAIQRLLQSKLGSNMQFLLLVQSRIDANFVRDFISALCLNLPVSVCAAGALESSETTAYPKIIVIPMQDARNECNNRSLQKWSRNRSYELFIPHLDELHTWESLLPFSRNALKIYSAGHYPWDRLERDPMYRQSVYKVFTQSKLQIFSHDFPFAHSSLNNNPCHLAIPCDHSREDQKFQIVRNLIENYLMNGERAVLVCDSESQIREISSTIKSVENIFHISLARDSSPGLMISMFNQYRSSKSVLLVPQDLVVKTKIEPCSLVCLQVSLNWHETLYFNYMSDFVV